MSKTTIPNNDNIPFQGGMVSFLSLEVEGVDTGDYPDFCDCWIGYGEWADGTPLTESELEGLQEEHLDLAYELASKTYY